jgi:hypothetical protein
MLATIHLGNFYIPVCIFYVIHVLNMVPHCLKRAQAEDVQEQDAENNGTEGTKRDKENCITRSLIICILHQVFKE